MDNRCSPLLFGPAMSIQALPNLSGDTRPTIPAGINDWGGVSPVTPDHVNPEAWLHLVILARATARQDKILCERWRLSRLYFRWRDLARPGVSNGRATTDR